MARELVKISVLARRAGVPVATIKHYLREGLVKPALRTGRTMAYYDASQVERIKTIKELQETRFLPLKVIKQMLDAGAASADDFTAAQAIARVLDKASGRRGRSRTRAQLRKAGFNDAQLDWLKQSGIVTPEGTPETYAGDDLALLETLLQARRAGLSPEMLPFDILQTYLQAIHDLAHAELRMFREGVLPRAGGKLHDLSETATTLSERLVVLLRRKMLLPAWRELLLEQAAATPVAAPARPARTRPKRRRTKNVR